mgnify:CR=1 FL=1
MKKIFFKTDLEMDEFNLPIPPLSPLKGKSSYSKNKRLSVPEEMERKLKVAKILSGMNKNEQLLSLLCDVDRELKLRK